MPTATEELLTVEELASFLKVPKATVYRWVHHKNIPFVKVGKHLRFKKEDVLEWLESRRVEVGGQ